MSVASVEMEAIRVMMVQGMRAPKSAGLKMPKPLMRMRPMTDQMVTEMPVRSAVSQPATMMTRMMRLSFSSRLMGPSSLSFALTKPAGRGWYSFGWKSMRRMKKPPTANTSR